MSVQVSYPGVYIDEVNSGGAIAGVGTSTAAFIGPAASGPLNEPVKITSWEQFKRQFGDSPLNGFYLWYAVRGFFQNGGTVCYVTRVSNGKFDEVELLDSNSTSANRKPVINLVARNVGGHVATISATVAVPAATSPSGVLFNPTVNVKSASGSTIEIGNSSNTANDAEEKAAQFRVGDRVVITKLPTSNTVKIANIEGKIIHIDPGLGTTTYTGSGITLKLADPDAQDKTVRVQNGEWIEIGGVLKVGTIYRTVESVLVERLSNGAKTFRVTFTQTLGIALTLSASVNVAPHAFDLTISQQGGTPKAYRNLSMVPGHSRYHQAILNNDPDGLVFAYPPEVPSLAPVPIDLPVAHTGASTSPLAGGSNEDNTTLNSSDYIKILDKLAAIDDINMVAIPDRTEKSVQVAILDHCEKMQDRFAILDSRRGVEPFIPDSVSSQLVEVKSEKGYASLYYPWLVTDSADGKSKITVPPSGHIAGIYARIDQSRGVHKSPAGTEAAVRGALDLERALSNEDQGQLNRAGINVIRQFSGGRPVVWGARTTADEGSDWQYVAIRRLFLFLEESIQESIRWAVFEPNNLALWQKLKRVIGAFLRQQWRDGALFGNSEEEAFFVRIDEDINPESERKLGRLYIEIGVRPAFPAEFIIIRIGMWQGGSQVLEN